MKLGSKTSDTPAPPPILYHYTTLDGLLGIINSKSLWATDIRYLNDASELINPLRIATDSLINRGTLATEYAKALEVIYSFCTSSQFNLFVSSFCQSDDLLSQWRGYGNPGAAYAIGFDTKQLADLLVPVDFELIKCRYESKKSYSEAIDASTKDFVVSHFYKEKMPVDFLPTFATLKLDCFQEEDEWRIIGINTDRKKLEFRSGKNMVIPYYHLALGNLSSIVKIMIGPCQNEHLAKIGVCQLLAKYDLEDLVRQDSIKNSAIPYRVV